MANQLFNQLNKKIMEQTVNNAINNNPQIKALMNELQTSGLTPKDFFYKKANEMGINPQEILKQLM